MANEKAGPGGRQPEALRSLKSAARSGSRKPDGQGYEARSDTAPKGAAPEAQAEGRGGGPRSRCREAACEDDGGGEKGAAAVDRFEAR